MVGWGECSCTGEGEEGMVCVWLVNGVLIHSLRLQWQPWITIRSRSGLAFHVAMDDAALNAVAAEDADVALHLTA